MKPITEATLLQIIRDMAGQYLNDEVRKERCTFMAYALAFSTYDRKQLTELLIQLIHSKKILSNIRQEGIEAVNAYLIPS